MKNLLRFWFGYVAALAFVIAPLQSYAVTEDPQVYSGGKIIPPRVFSTQQIGYTRATVNFNDTNIKNGVWFASIPAGAYILAIDSNVTTAFNAATTNVLTFGATKASANEIVADCGTASACISNNTTTIATGVVHLTTAAGLGLAVTNNTSLQVGYNSSGLGPVPAYIPIYVKYTQTGTAATTGQMTIVITYAFNNDL